MPTTSSPAIEVAGLHKRYGQQTVLDGIDLSVAEGSVFALLGPNGSGKTTTVRILSTLSTADAGRARVAGFDVRQQPDAVRAAIGVTGQFSAVDDLLTGAENLCLMADLLHLGRSTGRRRIDHLLGQFDLLAAATRPASSYSGGMRRRLDLAMTLVGRPRVIFLDEPTTGLDPRSRRALWQVVVDLVADGVTIFLTTQYLDEADHLADRIALLDGGRLIAEGTPAQLKRQVPGGHLRVDFVSDPALEAVAATYPHAVRDGTLTLRIPADGGLGATRAILANLDEDAVESFSLHSPDLDDVFLALTGHPPTPADRKELVR